MTRAPAFLALLLFGAGGCSEAPKSFAASVKAGDARACGAKETLSLLEDALLPSPDILGSGNSKAPRSMKAVRLTVVDPTVAEVKEREGALVCDGALALSEDGIKPFASNRIALRYELRPVVGEESRVVVRGEFTQARSTLWLMLQNVGMLPVVSF